MTRTEHSNGNKLLLPLYDFFAIYVFGFTQFSTPAVVRPPITKIVI